jgi:hypothetical protein
MLTPDQREHAKGNLKFWTVMAFKKYVLGQKEHQGNLWEKSGMLKNIETEIADTIHYVPTLRRQMNEVLLLLKTGKIQEAILKLESILSEETD